jgi:hypothetical protein
MDTPTQLDNVRAVSSPAAMSSLRISTSSPMTAQKKDDVTVISIIA